MCNYIRKGFFILLLLFFIPVVGCGDAKITEMMPGMDPTGESFTCWLTLEFKKYPDRVDDLTDVEVVFTSNALSDEVAYDWEFIATRDKIPLGLNKGHKLNEETVPDEEPPINMPIKVRLPLPLEEKIELDLIEEIWLKAELFWGGEKKSEAERTMEHLYRRKFKFKK